MTMQVDKARLDEMLPDTLKRLQDILGYFDEEANEALANEMERGDLWSDIEIPVADLRVLIAAAALRSLRSTEGKGGKPRGPELWGTHPITGFRVRISEGGHNEEEVASFEVVYAAAGWTDLCRTNPFSADAIYWKARAEAAEAHVAKLREALQELMTLNDAHSPFGGEMYQDRIDRAWDNARAALTRSPE